MNLLESCRSFIFLGWHHSHGILGMIWNLNVIVFWIIHMALSSITTYRVNLLNLYIPYPLCGCWHFCIILNNDSISEYLFLSLFIHCTNCLSILKDKGLLFLTCLSWTHGLLDMGRKSFVPSSLLLGHLC